MSLSISTYSIMGKIAAYFTGVWPSLSMWTTSRTPFRILIVELVERAQYKIKRWAKYGRNL